MQISLSVTTSQSTISINSEKEQQEQLLFSPMDFTRYPYTDRISVNANGSQGIYSMGGSKVSVISANGRYIAFSSNVLAPNPSSNWYERWPYHVYVRDRDYDNNGIFDEPGPNKTTTILISKTDAGVPGNLDSGYSEYGTEVIGNINGIDISSDGRYVAFISAATNFYGSQATGGPFHVYVVDRDVDNDSCFDEIGFTHLQLIDEDYYQNCPGYQGATGVSISDNGLYVLFGSTSRDMMPDNYSHYLTSKQLILQNRSRIKGQFGWRIRLTLPDYENADSFSISKNGKYVVYEKHIVFPQSDKLLLYNRLTNQIQRLDINQTGQFANAQCTNPTISENGRFICFLSCASNLVSGDTNGQPTLDYGNDVFVLDRDANNNGIFDEQNDRKIVRVSVNSNGEQQHGVPSSTTIGYSAQISADGRYVCFTSSASNLVPNDTNDVTDVFLHDCILGTTHLMSVSTSGVQSLFSSDLPSVSRYGMDIVFTTKGSFIPGDTNELKDIYLRSNYRLGDVNNDKRVDFFDIDPFVAALNGPDSFYSQYPMGMFLAADTNQDGTIDFLDIDLFVNLFQN
ncbi:MAG: hypothetical protein QXL17_04020 [Candidatus Thermoplasmatota archaeon]